MPTSKIYIVEHLDPELEAWSSLEYKSIARECSSPSYSASFLLSSVPPALKVPPGFAETQGMQIEQRGVEELFADVKDRVCLLDPAAAEELSPEDEKNFDVFLFGGILGDDPPRDRTSELRKKGYAGRRLGPVQMTTDTAVRTTRMVIQDGIPINKILYIDNPELRINEHESTEMPFRYVIDKEGKPIMPEGMVDLIKKDSMKSIGDLF